MASKKASITVVLKMDPEEEVVLKMWATRLWEAVEPHVEPWRADQAHADLLAALVRLGVKREDQQ